MNTNSQQRLVAICKDFWKAKSRKKVTQFCQSLRVEFGITEDIINVTEIERSLGDPNSAEIFARKMVKAVLNKLRIAVLQLALDMGIVDIGKPVPHICKTLILNKIGDSGMMICDNDKSVSIIDPIVNHQLIGLLEES